jgi:RNA polymerase sigma-70 factor, ECF subfamily
VTRAKKKISAARIPYRVPASADLPDRLDAVLTVVHLLYTTGHTAPEGTDLVRCDLVDRAIGLARMLLALMPDEREVSGLLALLLCTDARRATRTDPAGRLLRLEEQDRSQWDQQAIEEGMALLARAQRGGSGRFALQAAIASVHASAAAYERTDWARLVCLYDQLLAAWPSPVVALNRAVAVCMLAGPAAGLAEIGRLEQADPRLAGYRYLPAAKADMLRRLGRRQEAAAAYRAALGLADNAAEQAFLAERLAELSRAG